MCAHLCCIKDLAKGNDEDENDRSRSRSHSRDKKKRRERSRSRYPSLPIMHACIVLAVSMRALRLDFASRPYLANLTDGPSPGTNTHQTPPLLFFLPRPCLGIPYVVRNVRRKQIEGW